MGRIVYVSGIVLCFYCGIFLGHPDAHTISGWAKDLLDCIFSGKFMQFPEYTYALRDNATNYSLFANLIMSVMLLPLYIVDEALSLNLGLYGYVFYEKILILAITLLDAHIFGSIFREIGYSDNNVMYAKGLFMCSSIVAVATVAKGQIDAILVFFVLVAAWGFLKKNIHLVALMLGISIVIKPFSVLIAAPVLLLLIGELSIKGIIIPVIEAAAPFAIDRILTRILWPGYYDVVVHTDDASRILFGQTRMESLFSQTIGNVELFFATVLLACFLCLYKGINKTVKRGDFLIFPLIMYIALAAFVSATFYWYMAILPALILLGMRFKSRWSLPLLLAGNSIGALIPLLLNEGAYHISFYYNVIGKRLGAPVPKVYYDGMYRTVLTKSGATLFIVSMVLILVLYIREDDR